MEWKWRHDNLKHCKAKHAIPILAPSWASFVANDLLHDEFD